MTTKTLASHARIALTAVLCALLAACETVPQAPQAETNAAVLQALRTSDPDEIRRRFGDYENMVGVHYMSEGSNPVTFRRVTWAIPGVQINAEGLRCYESSGKCDSIAFKVQYDATHRRLVWIGNDGIYQAGIVNPDGSITISSGNSTARMHFDYDTREIILTGAPKLVEISTTDYSRLTKTWAESDSQVRTEERAEQRRKDRETAQNVQRAIMAFGQAYVETAREYQEQIDRSATLLAQQQMALARQEVQTRQQAAQAAARQQAEAEMRARASSAMLASTQSRVTPLPGSTATQQSTQQQAQALARAESDARALAEARAEAQAQAQARAQAEARAAQVSQSLADSRRAAAAEPQRPVVVATATAPTARPEGPKRIAYPEAVVVCTIPSGEQGRFVCENPVNRIGGHKDINPREWRTPESMVASFDGACSNARPLRSTTHRVWGCGFAATNKIVGYYDRAGPGVDVQGRQTFYCVEREQGCRRTQP